MISVIDHFPVFLLMAIPGIRISGITETVNLEESLQTF